MIERIFGAGERMEEMVRQLFPQNRSLVGPGIKDGFRQLATLFNTKPIFHHAKSGSTIGTWTVPKGWRLVSFQVKCLQSGKGVIGASDTNLRVWSHSVSFNGVIGRTEFLEHVRVHGGNKDAIPYITAYYSDTWGFSMSQLEVDSLCDGPFEVRLHTELENDELEIMEVLIPGHSAEEIFFSTYLCHPSMVINELSGPVVAAEMINAIEKQKNFYSYRFVFIPETLGSIFYSHKFLYGSNRRVLHAFNLNCLGGFKDWSFLGTKDGNKYTDQIVRGYLGESVKNFIEYPFTSRGSDERQYCNPNINLPMVSIMRKKYHEYSEYHTNLDNLDFNSADIFEESLIIMVNLCNIIEKDFKVYTTEKSEPFMNKIFGSGQLGGQNHVGRNTSRQLCDFLIYADGRTFFQICQAIGVPLIQGLEILQLAADNSLVRLKRQKCTKLRKIQL